MDPAPAVQPEPAFLNLRRDPIRFESHFASRLGASIHKSRLDSAESSRRVIDAGSATSRVSWTLTDARQSSA